MLEREDLTARIADKRASPSQILSSFNSVFKPLLEAPLPISRLAARKHAQNYGPTLLKVVKTCNSELDKKQPEDWSECLMSLMFSALSLVARISLQLFSKPEDYYSMWYCYLLKITEKEKHEEAVNICKEVVEEVSQTGGMPYLLLNCLVLWASSILKTKCTVQTLEEVYVLVAERCLGVIGTLKWDGSLNKVYDSAFKLLFKAGRMLDNLAGGNTDLHIRALEIRNKAFEFLKHCKPFIESDYFAFAYSSVQATFKVATAACSKKLYLKCIEAINYTFETCWSLDRNSRTLVELLSFLHQKLEDYQEAKQALSGLLLETKQLVDMFFNVRYYLDIARLSYLSKESFAGDLENAHLYLKLIFQKLVSPTQLSQDEIYELKSLLPKIHSQQESWLKIVGNLHSPLSLKQNPPSSSIKLYIELFKFYPSIVQLQEKISLETKPNWQLFYYIMCLGHFLVFVSGKSLTDSSLGLGYLQKLTSCSSFQYLSNTYNITLGLLHTGYKEVSFKCLRILFDYIVEHPCKMSSAQLALIELGCKFSSESKSYAEFIVKGVSSLIKNYLSENLETQEFMKLVDCYCKVKLTKAELHKGASFQREEFLGLSLEGVCFSVKGKILERELINYHSRLLTSAKSNKSQMVEHCAEAIQELVKVLFTSVYPPSSTKHGQIVLKYIEIISTCDKPFENEWFLEEMFSVKGTIVEKMIFSLKELTKFYELPQAEVWNSILYLEKIKELQHNSHDIWIGKESLALYVEAVNHLNLAAELVGSFLGYSLSPQGTHWEKTHEPRDQYKTDYCKSLVLASDVAELLGLPYLQCKLLSLAEMCVEDDLRKLCLGLRLVLGFWEQGKTQLATETYLKLPKTSVKSSDHIDCFHTELWVLTLKGEVKYNMGDLLEAENHCREVLSKIPAAHSTYRRVMLLKAQVNFLLSKIHLANGDLLSSFKATKEARYSINDIHTYTLTLQNLSLLNSIVDSSMSKFKENFSKAPRCTVFPYSSWNIQRLSERILDHLSTLYTLRSQVSMANCFLMQGIKLGRVLGIPSHYLHFRSKLSELQRQTLNNPKLCHDNINQTKTQVPDPVEFIENVFSAVFEPIVYLTSPKDTETLRPYEVSALSPIEMMQLSKYISTQSLIESLLTLGDILQTPEYLEQIQNVIAEQNYYKLAKGLLTYEHQGHVFRKLKALTYKKQANLVVRQKGGKECLELLGRGITHLGCCEDFLYTFLKDKVCCKNFSINPLVSHELGNCLLIFADSLMRKHDSELAKKILQQLVSFPGILHPTVERHTHFLLGKNTGLEDWTRAYHVVRSIGVSYTAQLSSVLNKDLRITSNQDLMEKVSQIPSDWGVVCISAGRGSFTSGLLLSRLSSDSSPFTVNVGACECTTQEPFLSVVEEFTFIMRESSGTTSKNNTQSFNKQVWWSKRERLNEKLEKWLDRLQCYLGELSSLMLGKILNKEIDSMIKDAAKDFCLKKCEKCGQHWNTEVVYHILNAVATEEFTLDSVRNFLQRTNMYNNSIFRKIRNIRKASSGKTIERAPVVLVLDGNLLHLPWESLKVLRGQQLTRLPSLVFLFPRLKQQALFSSESFYILNPSKDLPHTQSTFERYFNQQRWQGLSEVPPTESEFSGALETKDLVVYCGHSAGEQYLKGERIKDLKVKAVTMLMGCSSGLLKLSGQYEPQGIALQYLLGGCPLVVANLWDVTDKDIDRFALELFKRCVDRSEEVSFAVKNSKFVCKFPYLVGSAPVCYGVPVKFN